MNYVKPKFQLAGIHLYYGNVPVGKCYREVDGYYVWVPPNGDGGCYTSGHLKELSDFLDDLNEPWDTEVREYFENQQKENQT